MKLKLYALLIIAGLAFSSCTVRLVDFTTISSKNVNLDLSRADGKKVKASKSYFLGIGWNIKDALDLALEQAGQDYDLLIDGVVRYSSYPFVASVSVEGTAVSTRAMKTAMGEEGFNQWLKGQNVFDPANPVVENEE
ncbi:hypothetical protein [Tenacibaculum sp. IB213877]|uniref:hypothetical protein n=1 Tax=Tenacibaculum sp. IB213877 TaxID=3097351 RepID=UPI002A5A4E5E|nr:hypothetical protein [Tenacibaculum sp. IB213877]MDY0779859.1 hypothetical protein [Tenacibaculum sp. IB213877]